MVKGEAAREERACTAQSRRALIINGCRRPPGCRRPRKWTSRKLISVRVLAQAFLTLWGQPVREILCSKKGGVRVRVRPRHLVRALGPRILVRNILSRPNHPPLAPTLDLGTVSPPELERAAGTTLDSTQADDAHAASSASMCAHLMIRQAIRERAAVGRLRLRLRHRSCATTSSFESASA